jgi:hypothetical protein
VCFYENSNGSENSSDSCSLTSAPQLFSGKPTRRNMARQLMYFYSMGNWGGDDLAVNMSGQHVCVLRV